MVFGYCVPTKIFWILFSEIWAVSCTEKLDPIFSDLSKKNCGFKMFRFIRKKNWILEFLLVGLSRRCRTRSLSDSLCKISFGILRCLKSVLDIYLQWSVLGLTQCFLHYLKKPFMQNGKLFFSKDT